ncbi:MAG: nuclear transport factor 2 family protein, partial [Gemmatirosa sp.]
MSATTAMPSTTATDAVAIVRAIYDAFDRGDLAAILARVSPDAAVHQTTALPWGGHHHGHEGMQRFLGALTASVQAHFVPDAIFAAGEQVVSVGHSRGTV